jgi:hypothetical protein
MRRTRILLTVLLVPLLLALVSVSGCGKGKRQRNVDDGDTEVSSGDKASEGGGGGAGEKKPVVAKGYATLKGRVRYEGGRPNFAAADKAIQAQMQAQNDHAVCLAPSDDPRQVGQQDWILSKDGDVANVLIYLKPSGNDYFQLKPEEIKKKSWPEVVTVDQPHCAFMPRVVATFPEYKDATSGAMVASGQKFKVLNSAPVPHNTAWKGDPLKNPDGSQTLPPAKDPSKPSEIVVPFKPQREPVNIQCDIHKWMNGKVWVFNHPYAAVTKGDAPKDDAKAWGTYEIRDVPAGVDLYVVAWHEAARGGGYFLPEGKNGKRINLKDGEVHELDLTVSAK